MGPLWEGRSYEIIPMFSLRYVVDALLRALHYFPAVYEISWSDRENASHASSFVCFISFNCATQTSNLRNWQKYWGKLSICSFLVRSNGCDKFRANLGILNCQQRLWNGEITCGLDYAHQFHSESSNVYVHREGDPIISFCRNSKMTPKCIVISEKWKTFLEKKPENAFGCGFWT